MPQAKKSRFVVTGRIAGPDAANVGDIIELPVREDGLPESALMRSRVKPYKGELPKGGSADEIIAEAHAQAEKIIEDAIKQAEEIVKDAKKPAK